MLPTFIKLENTFEAAMSVNESPQVVFYDYSGIFLVSDNAYPYTQRTYASDGIEIEDFVIEFFDMCGNELTATVDDDTFKVIRNFQDPPTGLPQVEWQLNTANLDFGDQLIYFRLSVGVNTYVYSSPFTLSSDESKYSSQWWYKQEEQDNMLSIGLNMYFRNRKSEQELSNYTSLSTGYTTTGTSRLTPFERWLTRVINSDLFEEFKRIFLLKQVYSHPYNFNGLPIRTRLFEALESKDPTADENFNDYEVLLSRNPNFTYDPLAVPVVPPAPPVDPPEITLTNVSSINSNQVVFTFTFDNFTPEYLIYEYSLDSENWTSIASGTTSPVVINVPENDDNPFYYRITHPQATSNMIQLPVKVIVINNIIKPSGDPYLYRIGYALNYAPVSYLVFEYSQDNISFFNSFYADGNDNPKDVQTPSIAGNPWFRIKDTLNGVVSQSYQYTP